MTAPDRIWCSTGMYYDYADDWTEGEWYADEQEDKVEYNRADLHQAALAEKDAEIERLKTLLQIGAKK